MDEVNRNGNLDCKGKYFIVISLYFNYFKVQPHKRLFLAMQAMMPQDQLYPSTKIPKLYAKDLLEDK